VERCRAASIKVTMVTGDHPITAEAIARQVSIITLPTLAQVNEGLAEAGEAPVADELTDPRVQAIVRAGSQIRGLTEAQWDALLGKQEVVFARTTPEQKLEIVEHYQRLGEVVAVTGDGVNDSPALKRANIGLAMGGADASDVAREAGDIILMDSNFASIVFAIEEGRVLFDNLKKSIAYTLAHLLPELLPVFLNLAFAFPLALPGLVILTIDLITEQGPAVSFASEPAESAVMLLPPRDMKRDRLVSTPLLLYTYLLAGVPSMVVCMIAYFCTYLWHGIPIATLAGSSSTYFQVPNGATPDLVVGGKVFNEELQYAIYMQSVGAWYATLIMNQFWCVGGWGAAGGAPPPAPARARAASAPHTRALPALSALHTHTHTHPQARVVLQDAPRVSVRPRLLQQPHDHLWHGAGDPGDGHCGLCAGAQLHHDHRLLPRPRVGSEPAVPSLHWHRHRGAQAPGQGEPRQLGVSEPGVVRPLPPCFRPSCVLCAVLWEGRSLPLL
jgi:soluble P-type ATPase